MQIWRFNCNCTLAPLLHPWLHIQRFSPFRHDLVLITHADSTCSQLVSRLIHFECSEQRTRYYKYNPDFSFLFLYLLNICPAHPSILQDYRYMSVWFSCPAMHKAVPWWPVPLVVSKAMANCHEHCICFWPCPPLTCACPGKLPTGLCEPRPEKYLPLWDFARAGCLF